MISITFYLGIFSVVASLAQLGIFFWDRTYYSQVYGNLDIDVGWIDLATKAAGHKIAYHVIAHGIPFTRRANHGDRAGFQ